MNGLLQLSQPLQALINSNLKPSFMTSSVATTQATKNNSEEAAFIPEDELYAILWDNVYTGQ